MYKISNIILNAHLHLHGTFQIFNSSAKKGPKTIIVLCIVVLQNLLRKDFPFRRNQMRTHITLECCATFENIQVGFIHGMAWFLSRICTVTLRKVRGILETAHGVISIEHNFITVLNIA